MSSQANPWFPSNESLDDDIADVMAESLPRRLAYTPIAERDAAWHRETRHMLWRCKLKILPLTETPIERGPDGFPYLKIALAEPGYVGATKRLSDLLPFCFTYGTGAILVPSLTPVKGSPLDKALYSMSFGDIDVIWRFDGVADRAGPIIPFDRDTGDILFGRPPALLMPVATAAAMLRYIRERWAIAEPGIVAIAKPGYSPVLALDVLPSQVPVAPQTQDLAFSMVTWFLPPGVTLIGVKGVAFERHMTRLSALVGDAGERYRAWPADESHAVQAGK